MKHIWEYMDALFEQYCWGQHVKPLALIRNLPGKRATSNCFRAPIALTGAKTKDI